MNKFELPENKYIPTVEDLELCNMTLDEYNEKYSRILSSQVELRFHVNFNIDKLNDEVLQSKLRVLLGKHLYMISDEIKTLGLSDNIGLFGIKIGDKVM